MTHIKSNELMIKHTDKGSTLALMMSKYYWTMCQLQLNN